MEERHAFYLSSLAAALENVSAEDYKFMDGDKVSGFS